MTPADEATFISMWEAGASYRELAAALRCPLGTVASRAASLAAQGKIQPRQRGGAYPRKKAMARQDGTGGGTRHPTGVDWVSPDTPPAQYLPPSQDEMRPLLQDILLELRQLTGALAARVLPDTPPVSDQVSTRTPLPPERGRSVRWNLHLSERLRDQIKVMATMRGLQDSQMVEALLWLALSVRDSPPMKETP
jgi:hypothetical protein